MFKRVAILLLCLMMVFIATFGFVVGVVTVPTIFAYAEDQLPTGYTPVTDDMEFAQSFNDYCKSRDAYFTSTEMGATYTYVYNYMKEGLSYLGYNIDELQEGLYKKVENNEIARWYMNSTLMGAYNDLFAYLIRENDLEIGDQVDEEVYSGKIFIDDESNYSLIYVCSGYSPSQVTSVGTPYLGITYKGVYPSYTVGQRTDYTLTYKNNSYSYYIERFSDSSYYKNQLSVKNTNNSVTLGFMAKVLNDGFDNSYGDLAIIYNSSTGELSLGVYRKEYFANSNEVFRYDQCLKLFAINQSNGSPSNVTINFTSNNQTINNNIIEGDTIINNNGDVITDPQPLPPGGTDPGWDIGGGGGTATDGNGNTWNIQFPDFELPDLNIDWSINGLGEKFPFSIPFDLVALVTVLNAEPEAPRFEGTVNFGFTTWDYDINLQQFDSVAQACRIAELLLLVIGLILITRSIIKG